MSLYVVRIGKRLIYKHDMPTVKPPSIRERVTAFAKARGWDRLPSQARDVWLDRIKRWIGY